MNYIRTIALSFGYAEETKIGWLIYTAEGKVCDSRKQALQSLATHLFRKYCEKLEPILPTLDPCCKLQPKHSKYCGECGNYLLIQEREFEYYNWVSWLCFSLKKTFDSYGYFEDLEDLQQWNAHYYDFDDMQQNVLIVSNNAEHIISAALKEVHPELNTEIPEHIYDIYENICDESNVYSNGEYTLPSKYEGEVDLYKEIRYSNGAILYMLNDQTTHIKYNTGDIVYVKPTETGLEVVKYETCDGLKWEKNPKQ